MSCFQCQVKASVSHCGICEVSLCKSCRETLIASDFELMDKKPAFLTHAAYCANCYEDRIKPELEKYESLERLAKEVYFQSNNYRGNSHIINKHPKKITIEKCDDRRQLILMLAYEAAKLNFNAIVSADIRSKRIQSEGGYGYFEWSGSAIPANINGHLFENSRVD